MMVSSILYKQDKLNMKTLRLEDKEQLPKGQTNHEGRGSMQDKSIDASTTCFSVSDASHQKQHVHNLGDLLRSFRSFVFKTEPFPLRKEQIQ